MKTISMYHPYPRVSRRLESIHILAREITWQHDTHEPQRQHKWPRSQQRSKSRVGSGRVTPFPSVRLPHDTPHRVIRGWPVHYPGIHHYRRGEGPSNSTTIEATMFAGFHIAHMCQYTAQTCSPKPDDWSLTDTGGGYHRGALNMSSVHSQPSHPVFSTTL
jgi:hypothetical protein